MFPEHAEQSFLDPEYEYFDEYFQLGSRRNVGPVKNQLGSPNTSIYGSRRNIRLIDDLRKSRGLYSVSAYRHGLYIYRSMPEGVAQSSHAFVGGTLST